MTSFNRSNGPLATAFFGSLLLSLIALHFNPILPRDSIFYLDIASALVTEESSTATEYYAWPWISVAIAAAHSLTGLTVTNIGLLLALLLMAGTCTILTRASQLLNPDSGWWACLVSLSIPAFNSYRDSILRDPGQWFAAALVMLALALWHRSKQWRHLLLALTAIFIGLFFRLEAIFMLAPLALAVSWQLRSLLWKRRVLILSSFFALAAVSIFILLTSAAMDNSRVQYYFKLLNPGIITEEFSKSTTAFSESVLEKYSHDDAGTILVFGFIGLILTKALLLNGPFLILIPFLATSLAKLRDHPLRIFIISASACYLLILLVFTLQKNYMTNRYVALLHVFLTPLLAASAVQLYRTHRKLALLLIFLSVLTGLSNVISLSDKRTHYLAAGDWIKRNIPEDAHTYYSDGRVSYYAGRRYLPPPYDGSAAVQKLSPRYEFFVIDNLKGNTTAQRLIEEGKLQIIAEFDNGKRRHLSILRRTQ